MWTNESNKDMYSQWPIKEFKRRLAESVVNGDKDFYAIYDSYIKTKKSVLEIGGGYGRILDALKTSSYPGKIVCLERNQKLYDLLVKKYRTTASIIKTDILHASLNQSFDSILFMWLGFTEFSPEEQAKLLQKLSSLLHDSGIVAIDLPILDATSNREYFYDTPYGRCYRSFPSRNDLFLWGKKSNLLLDNIVKYTPEGNDQRGVYIFKRL